MKKILAGLMRPATMKETVIVALLLSALLGAQANHIGDFFIDRNLTVGGTRTALSRGTSVPGTCTLGDVFFDTDATAGSNWFGCTATNTWTAQGGSSVWSGFNNLIRYDGPGATRTVLVSTSSTVASDQGGGTCPECRLSLVLPNTAGSPAQEIVLTHFADSRYVTNGSLTVSVSAAVVATGTLSFDINRRCTAPGATYDPSWVGTTTISGSATNGNAETISGSVSLTCAAGSIVQIAVLRNQADANTGDAYVMAVGVSQ